ncbi:complex I 24 kDa subunit family protein [Caldovatus aquaticus]|uniref:NAD(P)H-dependent oxidoreductase subunit E n=1 Tax=Caldovatus aquaticus TaxID=2865671 RepID=A0ABS7EYR2_9PROT|nr:NAD(P)H-dependent oxidoreductase subunit E [Caldovatus aquaticus]
MGATQAADEAERHQPAHFAFDEESERRIPGILARYPETRKASAVIPLLWLVQEQMRRQTGSAWVPKAAMDVVAARLGMPPIRVYEVATFYFMFNTRPIGRHHLQVCGTTPCMLRGAEEVARACRDATGIKAYGETSADGMFTLSEVECLGACVNAPVLQVDLDYYEDLDYESTVRLIEALRRGERPRPGSVIGRQASAPEGERTTLLDVPGE